MKNTESQEMYISAIYNLRKNSDKVREIDIAKDRKLSRPSVFNAIKNLSNLGLVTVRAGDVCLTESGMEIAKSLDEKHKLIAKALLILGATPESAEINACRIEHVITDDIFEILASHVARGEKIINKQ